MRRHLRSLRWVALKVEVLTVTSSSDLEHAHTNYTLLSPLSSEGRGGARLQLQVVEYPFYEVYSERLVMYCASARRAAEAW